MSVRTSPYPWALLVLAGAVLGASFGGCGRENPVDTQPPTATQRPRTDPPRAGDAVGLYDSASAVFSFAGGNREGRPVRKLGAGIRGLGMLPIAGDWDGDGQDTIGVYHSETGQFYVSNTLERSSPDAAFAFGPRDVGALPITGDWNGDGNTTVGLYLPASGTFVLRNSLSEGEADITLSFGPPNNGAMPIVGDWNGDGTDTVGLYLPAEGAFILNEHLARGDAAIRFRYGGERGDAEAAAVAGDWDGDGRDSIGIYVRKSGRFYLTNRLSAGKADVTFGFGPKGPDVHPVSGNWSAE